MEKINVVVASAGLAALLGIGGAFFASVVSAWRRRKHWGRRRSRMALLTSCELLAQTVNLVSEGALPHPFLQSL